MITQNGSRHIKRYLAGFVPAIAQSVAIGIGSRAESSSETRLQFETGRYDVALTSYDFINNTVVYKAEIPDVYVGEISEIAIYPATSETISGNLDSRLLTTFDSETEDWISLSGGTSETYTATGSKLGPNSLSHTVASSGSKTSYMNQLNIDLSQYAGEDIFSFAFNVEDANASSVKFTFMTDSTNYYETSIGSLTAGYKFVEVLKSAMTATGAPTWESITEIRVTTNARSTGQSKVSFDGIRIENNSSITLDNPMVSRRLLSSSVVKGNGVVKEIEFALGVNI